MKKRVGSCVFCLAAMATGAATAEVIVYDSFESADMSSPGYDGFSWARNNRTSVVTMNPDPTSVWHNGVRDNQGEAWKDWTAYHGDYSLRFRYPPGVNWAEQRFALSEGYPELWVSFRLRVPQNFYHPTGNNNQKLFAIWMDAYEFSGQGATVVWQYRRSSSPEAGVGGSISRLYDVATDLGQDGRHKGERSGSGVFISTPSDQKRWMEVVFRVVAASEFDKNDGIAQMWRRWEGEQEYELLHDEQNLFLGIPAGSTGFKAGYLLGWANAPYSEDTEFLVDEFRISTTNVFEQRPKPPIGPLKAVD